MMNRVVESWKGRAHYRANCTPSDSPVCRHCADAVLSFANKATVVSRMMAKLMDFIVQWAQTPSDYDILIAKTITAEWAQEHLPVLSRDGAHVMYTGYNVVEPDGRPLVCHNTDCGVENRVWEQKRNGKIRLCCLSCRSKCTVDQVALDTTTTLGRRELLKVSFPPPPNAAGWQPDPDEQTPRQQRLLAGPPPRMKDLTDPPLAPSLSVVPPSDAALDPSPPPTTPSPSPSPSFSQPPPSFKLKIPPLPMRNDSRAPSTSSESGRSSRNPREASSTVHVICSNADLARGRQETRRQALSDIPPVRISTTLGHNASSRSRKRQRED